MKKNLLKNIPRSLPEELIEVLCQSGEMWVERIVSRGHSSPEGFWYDQDDHEFLVLVKGRACLKIEGRTESMVLEPGDWTNIQAHVRHRVEWTTPDEDTVWLAVYYR
ncbi:MAG: cupin domain-containing protein [bacterium]